MNVFPLFLLFWFLFFSPSLRRSSCSCLPCGGEGHGATRGAGAGRRTDRSVHGHILLPRSGHSVKKEKRPQNEPAWRTEQKPKRVERANQRLSFIRCHRCYGDEKRWQRCSGPTGQDVLQQSHPSLTKLYTWRSFFFQVMGTAPSSGSGLQSHAPGVFSECICANSLPWDDVLLPSKA